MVFITILQCEGFYSSSREQLDLQHINLVLSNKLHSKVIHQSLIVIHSTSDDFQVQHTKPNVIFLLDAGTFLSEPKFYVVV